MTTTVTSTPSGAPSLSGSAIGGDYNFQGLNIGMFQVTFGSGASGFVRLTRATDGLTFKPYINAQDQSPLGILTASGVMNIWEEDPSASFRLEAALTSGSVSYSVVANWQSAGDSPASKPEAFPTQDPRTRYTTAQLQQQSAVKNTALSDADLSGDLTLFKRCRNGGFAKLLVPASARRAKGPAFVLGQARDIRAEYARVVSVFDRNGLSLPSAQSYIDPGATTYVAGQTVTARHMPTSYGTTFDDSAMGIYGYPTLLEAVTMGAIDMREAPSNLAALGL